MIHVIGLQKIIIGIVLVILTVVGVVWYIKQDASQVARVQTIQKKHWFILHRKSNKEELYYGVSGDKNQSVLLKTFIVKTGVPGEKPTPLPQLVGRKYWLITAKEPVAYEDNPETAPYFLTLDVPISEEEPYGPTPYLECDGQCNWQLPGLFGLHGVASDESKLSSENAGSSGCIRHRDEDITYLYNLLNTKEEIRYYVFDS